MSDSLYIIGNGFDLYHELKTSYVSFRDEYVKKHPQFQKQLYDIYGDVLDQDMWWSHFEVMLGHIDYKHLMNTNNGNALGPFITKNLLRNVIPFHFGEWIKTVFDPHKLDKKLLLEDDSLFFTFNYTMVLEQTYHIEEADVWHIHNSVTDYILKGNNPVVGHDLNDAELTKGMIEYRNQHPETTSFYIDDVNQMAKEGAKKVQYIIANNESKFYDLYSDIKHFIVMGFSFNEIDLPYIKKIIAVNKDIAHTDWKIYYHSDGEDLKIREVMERLGVCEGQILPLIKW